MDGPWDQQPPAFQDPSPGHHYCVVHTGAYVRLLEELGSLGYGSGRFGANDWLVQ